MRISFVSLFYPDDINFSDRDAQVLEAPREYLERFSLYRHLPQALAARGHDVQLVQLYPRSAVFQLNEVTYRFVASPLPVRRIARAAGATFGYPAANFETAMHVWAALGKSDVVHVHGTQLHLNIASLLRRTGSAALVLHYHGGFPPQSRLLRAIQRRNFDAADALLFTSSDQADAFIEFGILRDPNKVFELVETSSAFQPMRRAPRLSGRPVFVSACRLHPIKDPLTTLRGFERILDVQPEAELHHFYLTDELLPELRAYVSRRPRLEARVHFCGSRPHSDMEAIFNGTDVLLQASVREFSGCAVLDAMACGVIPVLSDIPPFRKITGDGRAGKLFEPGDPDGLADCVCGLSDFPRRKAAVRAYFDQELSYDAMAERLETVYRKVMHVG